jgi:hypothetical protein
MGQKRRIEEWVKIQRCDIEKNLKLIINPSDENDIIILLSFLRDLLVRAMRGEAGERIYKELKSVISDKNCLKEQVYVKALKAANYRWGAESGSELISKVVGYFGDQLNWNWQHYLDEAKDNKQTNFSNDYLLTIRNIGFKVRDLALSSFDTSYAAFDLHVSLVPTRIGLLNYGFELLGDPSIEMGNNPADQKNYLFMHKLFLKLADLTNNEILPVDLDRIFWHFGRTFCGSIPKCKICPINHECLTGTLSSIHTIEVFNKPPIQRQQSFTPSKNDRINLPYGDKGDYFAAQDLADYILSKNRKFIIIGGENCILSEHKKPQSLDYWLRSHYTQRKNTRQAARQVIEKLIASGLFKLRNDLACPDTGRLCMGLAMTELKQDVEGNKAEEDISSQNTTTKAATETMPKRGDVFKGKVNDLCMSDASGWRRRDIWFFRKEIGRGQRFTYPAANEQIVLIDTDGVRYDLNFSKPDLDERVCLGTPGKLKPWYQKREFDLKRVNPDEVVYFEYTGESIEFLILTKEEFIKKYNKVTS